MSWARLKADPSYETITRVHVVNEQSVSFGSNIKNGGEMTYPTAPEKFTS